MRFVAISDTHGFHHQLELPPGDVLIHSGDATKKGELDEISEFGQWFDSLDFKTKIFVAGNHDFGFQTEPQKAIKALRCSTRSSIIYLQDQSYEIPWGGGIKVWGSPWQPWYHNWAFNLQQDELSKIWVKIPEDTDILVTHGPPFGAGDQIFDGTRVGCPHLARRMSSLNVKINLCGHIHESYGKSRIGNTLVWNSSLCDLTYKINRPPMVFDWKDGAVFPVEAES